MATMRAHYLHRMPRVVSTISETSNAERVTLQRQLSSLLEDLERNPARRSSQLKEKCLAITDLASMAEANTFSIPAIVKGGRP